MFRTPAVGTLGWSLGSVEGDETDAAAIAKKGERSTPAWRCQNANRRLIAFITYIALRSLARSLAIDLAQCVRERSFQFLGGAVNCLHKSFGLMRHRDGLHARHPRLQHATFIILAALVAVLIAQVNFNSRDTVAQMRDCILYHSLHTRV
jgi:hypothetical protein